MDTVVEQCVFGSNAADACKAVTRLLRQLEDRLSFFRPGSDVRRLNDAAGMGVPVPISADAMCVLRAALDFADKSGGAFDITAAPLSECWRRAAACGEDRAPDDAALSRARALVGSDGLRVDHAAGTAMLLRKCSAIDLGGIAKGYAADCAIKLYRDLGIETALINLGGNVGTLGVKPDGQQWTIGLQDPDAVRGIYFGTLRVSGVSVVTSGGYERFSVIGNEKHHHIIDPASGWPTASGMVSVTVIAGESMCADALSTAIFVLGLERAGSLLAQYPGTEAVLVDTERRIWVTEGAWDNFQPTPGYGYSRILLEK